MTNHCPRCLSSFTLVRNGDACEFCDGRPLHHRQHGSSHTCVIFEDVERPAQAANTQHIKAHKRRSKR